MGGGTRLHGVRHNLHGHKASAAPNCERFWGETHCCFSPCCSGVVRCAVSAPGISATLGTGPKKTFWQKPPMAQQTRLSKHHHLISSS